MLQLCSDLTALCCANLGFALDYTWPATDCAWNFPASVATLPQLPKHLSGHGSEADGMRPVGKYFS